MARFGNYEPVLQMFIQEPQPADMKRLWFLRWLIEQGDEQDGTIMSQPIGELADTVSIDPNIPIEEDLLVA